MSLPSPAAITSLPLVPLSLSLPGVPSIVAVLPAQTCSSPPPPGALTVMVTVPWSDAEAELIEALDLEAVGSGEAGVRRVGERVARKLLLEGSVGGVAVGELTHVRTSRTRDRCRVHSTVNVTGVFGGVSTSWSSHSGRPSGAHSGLPSKRLLRVLGQLDRREARVVGAHHDQTPRCRRSPPRRR